MRYLSAVCLVCSFHDNWQVALCVSTSVLSITVIITGTNRGGSARFKFLVEECLFVRGVLISSFYYKLCGECLFQVTMLWGECLFQGVWER